MLTEYQRGSIFGAVIVAIAFAASFSTIQSQQAGPSNNFPAKVSGSQQQGETFWEAASEPAALFTGALVVIGGLQAALFFWQLGLIRAGSADAREAANAARDTAKATGDAVTLARLNASKELRAYVFAGSSRIDNFVVGGWVTTRIDLNNAGRTPANNLESWSGIVLREYPLRTELKPSPINPSSKSSLAPGGETSHIIEWPKALSQEEFDHIIAGRMAIYVFGGVAYEDVFKEPHFMRYRLMYGGGYATRTEE
jgi:hypothetical protein